MVDKPGRHGKRPAPSFPTVVVQRRPQRFFGRVVPPLLTQHQPPKNIASLFIGQKHYREIGILQQQVAANPRFTSSGRLAKDHHIRVNFVDPEQKIHSVAAFTDDLKLAISTEDLIQSACQFRTDFSYEDSYAHRLRRATQ
jgi:tellurite resistance-related uncharacterized protein